MVHHRDVIGAVLLDRDIRRRVRLSFVASRSIGLPSSITICALRERLVGLDFELGHGAFHGAQIAARIFRRRTPARSTTGSYR